jgi:hypothetical protein
MTHQKKSCICLESSNAPCPVSNRARDRSRARYRFLVCHWVIGRLEDATIIRFQRAKIDNDHETIGDRTRSIGMPLNNPWPQRGEVRAAEAGAC